MGSRTEPFIVAAACRSVKMDVIFVGARHYDMLMRKQIDAAIGNAATAEEHHEKLGIMDQGFVDQFGHFHDREKAMTLAKAAGQEICLRGCGGSKTTLYSEGLY